MVRLAILPALLLSGCVHHLRASEYRGGDGLLYFEVSCDQRAGPFRCIEWANSKCDDFGAPVFLSANRDLGVPGINIAKIEQDLSLKSGMTRITGHCSKPPS